MGLFSRLKTGWTLSMDSLRVLRAQPSLAVFPAIAGIAGAIYVGLLWGGAMVVTGPDPGPVVLGALFLVYLGAAFITSFGANFGVGLVTMLVTLANLLGQTLAAIVKAALYVYATEGTHPAPFRNVDFDAAGR